MLVDNRPQSAEVGAICVPSASPKVFLRMAKSLTDSAIKALKAPVSGRLELADLRCAGLSYRITAAGVRSWTFRFRDPQSGKDARFTVGHYPDISLGEARKAADGLRGK